MADAKEICRWYETLKSARINFDNIAQQIIDHIDSHHPDVTTIRMPGQRKNQFQFDGTAQYGSHVFSQFVQGAVFNQATTWFSLKHREPSINKNQDAASWLNDTRNRMLAEMRPSFYGPAGQCVNGWTLFGNGPLLIEEVPKQERKGVQRLKYTSIPWGQYVMAEGIDGKIDKFIRCLKLPAHQAVKLGDVSDAITTAAEKEPMKEFEILHSIMPRDLQAYSKSKIKTNKEYDFASCMIELEKKRIIKESGYRKFPVAIARYDLIAGEVYARGKGEIALSDQKSLSHTDESALLKWDRELDPPLLVRRGSVIGNIISTQSKGLNVVTDINNSIRPLIEGSNWQAHDMMADRKQKQILQVFNVNEILNLLAREKIEMTAFEVNARLNLLQQIIGPIFGLLESEFLAVIIDVTLDYMAHIPGMLDNPPEIIASSPAAAALDIVYEGPLARAQRNQEIENIQRSIADIGGMQPIFGEAPLMVDGEKVIRRLFEIRSTQDLLVDEEKFQERVTELQQQQAAQQQAQLIAGGAQALGAAAPGIKALREIPPGQAAAA